MDAISKALDDIERAVLAAGAARFESSMQTEADAYRRFRVYRLIKWAPERWHHEPDYHAADLFEEIDVCRAMLAAYRDALASLQSRLASNHWTTAGGTEANKATPLQVAIEAEEFTLTQLIEAARCRYMAQQRKHSSTMGPVLSEALARARGETE